jgi:hypothetical protein
LGFEAGFGLDPAIYVFNLKALTNKDVASRVKPGEGEEVKGFNPKGTWRYRKTILSNF